MRSGNLKSRRIGFAYQPLDLVAGPDRHSRFGDHDGESGQRARDLARGGVDVAEIGMAIAAPRRRSDRDEDGVSFRHRRLQVGRKAQAPRLHIGRHQRIEPGLKNRNLAAQQGRDLVAVLVHAGDLMAEIGKTGAGHQPHIARANHGNPHGSTCRFDG
jgi:hypothetical protein